MTTVLSLHYNKNAFSHLADSLSSCVSTYEQQHIYCFRQEENRYQSLLGRLVVRYGIARYYGIMNPTILHDTYGRPYIKDNDEIDFNITHSEEWVAVIFSSEGKAGIDIEVASSSHITFPETIFHPYELEAYNAFPPADQKEYFFTRWTLKEAYIKAIGTTFLIPLQSFYFSPVTSLSSFYQIHPKPRYPFMCQSHRVAQNVFLSYCYTSEGPETSLQLLSLDTLLAYFMPVAESVP